MLLVSHANATSPPRVEFVYERHPSASDCPDREAVLNAVRARLGFDPFVPPPEIALRARVERKGDELQATILLSGQGVEEGERHITSHRADCTELASAMDLALSIAIDPLSIMRESGSSQSIIVVPMSAPAPAPPPPTSPAPQASSQKFIEANLGLAGNVGSTVGPTVGMLAGAALRGQGWSVQVEGRADLPRSRAVGNGHVDASVLGGTLAPCVHREPFGACLLVSVAALRGSGRDLNDAQQLTTTFLALGARAQVEMPRTGPVAFRLHLDLMSPLSRITLKVGDAVVWTSPPVNAALGLAAVVRFR